MVIIEEEARQITIDEDGAVINVTEEVGVVIEVERGERGPAGAQGPAGADGADGDPGPPGPPGTTTWAGITDKPTSFSPSTHGNEAHTVAYVDTSDIRLSDSRTPLPHAASHLMGGSDAIFPIDTLDLDVTAGTPAYSEGRVFWDATAKTWAIMTSPDTTLQIGQETVIRCHNDGETTITNGTPVMITGGNEAPIISPAYAAEMEAMDTIGIATQDIPAGGFGFVTAFGMVNGINTAGLTGTVYLASAGGLTSTKPEYPDAVIHIGHVVEADAVTGRLFIDIKPETFQKFFDVFNLGGVHDRTQSTLAYNQVTREMSIAPTGLYWAYFAHGVEYRVTVPHVVIHPATTGGHFFYIDPAGQFVTSTTPWDLLTDTPLMYVYYNATTGEGHAFEERHGVRDPEWHRGQHNISGTYYVSGLAANGYTLTTATDAAVRFGIDSGIIRDEDLSDAIAGQIDGGTYNIFHRAGVNGDWQMTQSTMPYLYGTYAQWNQFTGATWQMTDLANGDFYNIYVVAVPNLDPTKTIVCIPGQQKYASLANAQNGTIFTDVAWGAIPFVELSVIHRFTMRAGAGYGSTGKARVEAYADLRGTTRSVQVSGGAGTTHNGLAGLNTGDYLHLTAAEYAGMLPEAPIDGKQYARKDGAWVEVTGGGGGSVATETGQLDFGSGKNMVSVALAYPAVTADTVMALEFTDKLEEVIIQDMRIRETGRQVGVGFTVAGFAPERAAGIYQFRALIREGV